MSDSKTVKPLDIALGYIERGWSPIPVPFKTKGGPDMPPEWPKLRITKATVRAHFNGKRQNVGVLTGEASDNLVDIDLDHPMALILAPFFLPPTDAVFGRKSKPKSHWLYVVHNPGELMKFEDPSPPTGEGAMLVEFRATGTQTVFPGSVHPTGEAIRWDSDGKPALAVRNALQTKVECLAAATLIARRWTKGKRDDLCAAVIGVMLRGGFEVDKVKHFVDAICAAAGDEESAKLRLPKVASFDKKLKRDDAKVPGRPKLTKLVGADVTNKFCKWLGINSAESDFADAPVEVGEWRQPHDFIHDRPVPSFNAADAPACVGDYATRWGQSAGFDSTGVIASCIVTAAASLHDAIRLSVQPATGWYESARLWSVIIGAPGMAKTPATRAGSKPLMDIHEALVKDYANEVMLAEMDQEPGDKKKGAVVLPLLPALYTNDCTIEKLSEILAANPGGILYSVDEFDSWLGSHDAYRSGGSKDRGEWLSLFDGGSHQTDRIIRGSLFVKNWGVSLLSATTPTALARLFKKLQPDGLLQRVIPFMIGMPTAPDPSVDVKPAYDRYCRVIQAIHGFDGSQVSDVVLSPAARKVFDAEVAYFRELAPQCGQISEGLAGNIAKYGSILSRIVLTFHAIECADVGLAHPVELQVEVETVELARRFMRKAFQHARTFYGQLSGRNASLDIARRVGVALVADNEQQIVRRDLIQRYESFREATEDVRQEAMQMLVDFDWCRVVKGRYDKGYPTQWDVNPAIHERFSQDGEEWLRRRELVRGIVTGQVAE